MQVAKQGVNREKERESIHSFVWEKYRLNEKMISNLYKIKQVEEKSKYKREEGNITVKQWRDKEAKRKGKGWKKRNNRYVN